MIELKKIVPQKSFFDKAESLKKGLDKVGYLIIFISIFVSFCESFIWFSYIETITYIAVIVLSVSNVFIRFWYEASLVKAENVRRDAFIDNSFLTKLSSVESKRYFDTEEIGYGIKKSLANMHQNCYFTNAILNKMAPKKYIKLLIMISATIAIALCGIFKHNVVLTIVTAFLSSDLIMDCSKLFCLKKNLEELEKRCKLYASKFEENNENIGGIIREVINYEVLLTQASIMLDSEIYNQSNSQLTKEWKDILNRYYK